MWDMILLIVIISTPVIIGCLYFVEEEQEKNKPVFIIVRILRKGITFILKGLSIFRVGDINYVTDIAKDIENGAKRGTDNVKD